MGQDKNVKWIADKGVDACTCMLVYNGYKFMKNVHKFVENVHML